MSASIYRANLSSEGYTYTKRDGLVTGLATYGVIQPERKIRQGEEDKVWDAVVIGAGYAGLVAARDLVKAGMLRCSAFESCFTSREKLTLLRYRQKDSLSRSPRPHWWPHLER